MPPPFYVNLLYLMLEKNIIIGLGGCGGRSIQEFRRTVVKRQKEFDSLRNSGSEIDYLYIDSADDFIESLNRNDDDESGRLGGNDVVMLCRRGERPDIDSLSRLSNIAPWIGDMKSALKQWGMQGCTDEELEARLNAFYGSGQLRRYGRALFALNVSTVSDVLRRKIQKIIRRSGAEVAFHIFASLGGGTGSGCLIDMVMLIRHLCEQMRVQAGITVYAYVGHDVAASTNAGFFYENQYCTLRDLNALMTGAYRPHDITGLESERSWQGYPLIPLINRVCLSTDMASRNLPLSDQIKTVVKACYEAIVYCASFNSNHWYCLDVLSGTIVQDDPPRERAAGSVHSKRFATLGVKTMRYPTAEIRDYLFSRIEVRVWKSILDGSRLPGGCERKHASPGCFCFTYQETQTFEVYQQMVSEALAPLEQMYNALQKGRVSLPHALKELHDLSEKTVCDARKLSCDISHIKGVDASMDCAVRKLESHLIKCLSQAIKWRDDADVWGLEDVCRYLHLFRKQVECLPDEILPNSSDAEIKKTVGDICNNMRERVREGEKVGFFTKLLTTRSKLMVADQYADAVKLVKTSFMHLHKQVIGDLLDRILRMLSEIDMRIHMLIGRVREKLSRAEQRGTEYRRELHERRGHNDNEVWMFDAQLMDSVALAIEENAGLFEKFIPEIVASISSPAGKAFDDIIRNPSIFDNSSPMSQSEVLPDILQQVCSAAPLPCPLDGNIADELVHMSGGNPDMWDARFERFIRDFARSVHLNSIVPPQREYRESRRAPNVAFAVGLPKCLSHLDMDDWLRERITQSLPDAIADAQPLEFYELSGQEEIRILCVAYYMPCHFMPITQFLEERYRQSLEKKRADIVYFANIDASGEDESAEFSRPPLTC